MVYFFCLLVGLSMVVLSVFTLAPNGLQLKEVDDFGVQNCLPPQNPDSYQGFYKGILFYSSLEFFS